MEYSEPQSSEQTAGWLRRSARNFSTLTAAEVVKVGLNAAVTVYLARVLRAEAFGIFGFALAAVAYLTAVVDGGFTLLGTRDVGRDRSAVPALVRAIVAIRLTLACAAFLLLFGVIAGTALPPLLRRTLLWSSLSVLSTALLLDWVFYGLAQVREVSAAAVMKAAVFLAIVLVAVREPADVWVAAAAQVAGELVAASWLWAVYVRRFGSLGHAVEWRSWFHRWRQALPISAGQILRAVNYWFGLIVLGLWLDPLAVGQYTGAQKLMLFVLGFASLYFLTYLPLVSGALKRDPAAAGSIMSRSFAVTASLTLPLAFGATVLADKIVLFVYGADYAASTVPIQILIWVVPLVIAGGHFRNTLLAANLQRLDLGCVVLSAAANVAATLALVPTFGTVGAAIAMTISETTLLVSGYVAVRRRIARPSIAAQLPAPLAASALMALVVWWARPLGLPAAIGLGVFLYFGLLCLFGKVRPADMVKLFRA